MCVHLESDVFVASFCYHNSDVVVLFVKSTPTSQPPYPPFRVFLLPLGGDAESLMFCLLGTETSTNLHQKLYFHVLGTPQSEDVLCAEFPDHPKWMAGAEVFHDFAFPAMSANGRRCVAWYSGSVQ